MAKESEEKKRSLPRYFIKEGKLVRRLKECPRCGSSMGVHSDRFACGKCGYTEFLKRNG